MTTRETLTLSQAILDAAYKEIPEALKPFVRFEDLKKKPPLFEIQQWLAVCAQTRAIIFEEFDRLDDPKGKGK